MAVTYTTAAKVASLLRLIVQTTQARLTFGASTDPTLTEVETLIYQSEDDIDRETNHAWRAKSITNEYHNVKGLYTGAYRRDLPVKLQHRSVRAMTSGTDKIEIWDGSNWKDLVLTANGYTEGRANDFWVDYTNGIIYFVNTTPYYAEKGVRATYRYGESSVPLDVEEACTKLAATKILENEDYKIVLPEGVSQYALASKAENWKRDVQRILNNHKEILLAAP